MKLNQKSRFGLLALALLSVQLFTACTGTQKSKKGVPTSYGINSKAAITNTEARLLYVDLYKTIAIREMERTGIPASIKLAQGILESNSGRSKYNNHFGIKCHSEWTGERFYKEDDDKDPVTGQLIKSCFRAYKAGDESFIAHSEFIRDPRKVNRYGFLFQLDPKDYVGWANGLERAGYATATDYSEKLIRIIEDMQLSKYDQMSSRDVANNNPTRNNGNTNNRPDSGFDNPNSSPNIGNSNNSNNSNMGVSEGRVNDTRVLKVSYPLTLEQLAGRYDISIKKLQDYNEEIGGEGTKLLRQGSFVYLQKKRNSYSGNEKYHRVQACESMYDISQKYGIKLSKLYRKNEMREGDQPQAGEKIILRRGLFQSFDMPALRDTFGEWRNCNIPIDTITNRRPAPPSTANRPPTINNSGEFTFDIAPGGSGQPQSNYPTNNTSYPQTSYPQNNTNYPQGNYPQTSQPSSGTTYYPSSTTSYPSSGSNTTYYPSDNNNPSNTTTYPSSGSNNYPTTDVNTTSNYPSYPSRPTTQPSRPTTQPSRPATQPTTTTPRPTTQPTGAVQYHTVAKGDTMYGLSKKFGVTVDRLRELNGMADTNIKIGQQLRVK
jgi:LysM repeat protein